MKKLVYLSTSVVFLLAGIISCKQAPVTQIINGIVYDASMNNLTIISDQRLEERRVGKDSRSRRSPYH